MIYKINRNLMISHSYAFLSFKNTSEKYEVKEIYLQCQ